MTNRQAQDDEVLASLAKASYGRTARDLTELAYLAHEKVARDSERAKHNQLIGHPFSDRKNYLLDGEGSHHIIVSFGLSLEALLRGDEAEFAHQLDQLFKSCMLGHSDYAMQIRAKLEARQSQ
jgi:hypothetical protein